MAERLQVGIIALACGALLLGVSEFASGFTSIVGKASGEAVGEGIVHGVTETIVSWSLAQEQWTGEEQWPDFPKNTNGKDSKGCKLADHASSLTHSVNKDDWTIKTAKDGAIVEGTIMEPPRNYTADGHKDNGWAVFHFTGNGHHGTLYLERVKDYYVGYQISDNCHSETKGAALICPYILYKKNDQVSMDAAEADSRFKGVKCKDPAEVLKANSVN